MSALRLSHPGRPTVLIEQRDPYWTLTQRQRQILDSVRSTNGNRSRAARDLGVSVASVQAALRLCRRAGAPVPPIARRGPDLRPRRAA